MGNKLIKTSTRHYSADVVCHAHGPRGAIRKQDDFYSIGIPLFTLCNDILRNIILYRERVYFILHKLSIKKNVDLFVFVWYVRWNFLNSCVE